MPDSIVRHFVSSSTKNIPTLEGPINYYRLRNTIRLIKQHTSKKSYREFVWYLFEDMVQERVKNMFKINVPMKYRKYDYLALVHSVFNIKGKRIKPEKYI